MGICFSNRKASGKIRNLLAVYKKNEDLINIGAYVKGSNPKIDYALTKIEEVNEFLKQGTFEQVSYEETVERLLALFY